MLGRDKWLLSTEVAIALCARLVAAITVKNLTISEFSREQRSRVQMLLYTRLWRAVVMTIIQEINDTGCIVIYA